MASLAHLRDGIGVLSITIARRTSEMIRLRSEPSSTELEDELVSAWQRYLRAIRAAPIGEYDNVEDVAWRRLCHELAELGVTGYPPT